MASNLCAILRQAELLTREQEQSLSAFASHHQVSMLEALMALDVFSAQQLCSHLKQLFHLEVVELQQVPIAELCSSLGLKELVMRYQCLPVSHNHTKLVLAAADPCCGEAESEFGFATGLKVEWVLANYAEIKTMTRHLFGQVLESPSASSSQINHKALTEMVELTKQEQDASDDTQLDSSPISQYINQVLLDAVAKQASDIHFEPYENTYRIRLRCDGILTEVQQPSVQLSQRLSARLKAMAQLNIAERRLPQDGRLKLRLSESLSIDLRISSLPTLWGEKIVLRLLDNRTTSLDINKLGYTQDQKQRYLAALAKPQGLILMTGPTGSGKSVSMYTGLKHLNTSMVNISTAEDPVEIRLEGINQVQVRPKIGFDFAEALRAFLRQDPDIIMVGEIRDLETAEIAIKAAHTGHLVLSTLHTNSAAETLTRLSNMGVNAANLASSLSLLIAQRLARRLCQHCKLPQSTNPNLKAVGITEVEGIYQANHQGCSECIHGYRGRVGIYEVMSFSASLAEALLKGASSIELESIAISEGMMPLKQAGIDKLRQGLTSFEELQRVLFL